MWPFNKNNGKTTKVIQRKFDAGQSHDTLSKWITSSIALFDDEIKSDLETLRARSRDASINDVYARRYFKALSTNVVSEYGIKARFKITDNDSSPDKFANNLLDKSFGTWSKLATIDDLSFAQSQKLFLETMARDGECIVQLLRGKDYGKYGLQLRFIEADYLDINYSENLNNGNTIRSSIEYDNVGRIIAYWIYKYHPKDKSIINQNRQERTRILKSDIIHGYDKERSSQSRGFPWLSAALTNLTHLKEYQKSELIAARIASAKMGFYTKPTGESDIEFGDEDNGELIQEVNPGTFEILPEGYGLQTFDPQNPNGNFKGFVKVVLRSIAASLSISDHTLSADLESTSYSSLRQGAIDERDTWRQHQQHLIKIFVQPVFDAWLEMALISKNEIQLPFEKLEKFSNIEWIPRTWALIDPAKDAKAIEFQLNNKIKSRSEVVRSLGRTFEDVIQEIAAEKLILEKYNITDDELDTAMGIDTSNDLQEQIEQIVTEMIESEIDK